MLGNTIIMRLALLTLAASAVALSSAYAQDASMPAAPPAAPAADTAAPATLPPPPGMAAAEIAAPPPQELAPLPTDPLGLTLIDTLEKVCKPISEGGANMEALAKANGFTLRRRIWTRAVVEGGVQLTLQPVSVANPTTCVMLVNHPKGEFQNLVNGMHAWASRQDPVMQLRAPYSYEDQITKTKRTTVGWEAPSVTSATGMTGMAFTQLALLNGRDIVRGMDQSELMYQKRK
jgi:hypothetical protein